MVVDPWGCKPNDCKTRNFADLYSVNFLLHFILLKERGKNNYG